MTSTSDSADACRIHLLAAWPGTEFIVRDSRFALVAQAVSRLDVTVAPGLYQIERRLGDAHETEEVAVRPGYDYVDTAVDLPLLAVAPVAAASRAGGTYRAAAESVSAAAAASADPEAACLVVVADVTPDVVRGQIHLLEDGGRPVEAWRHTWSGEQVAAWHSNLHPRGYLLRRDGIDTGLWLPAGWQSIVFLQRTSDGFDVSIHLVPADRWWRADSAANTAVEVARTALLRRRAVFRRDVVDMLLRNSLDLNPMVGILAAHSLRLEWPSDEMTHDLITDRLMEILPDYPDVVALSLWREGALAPSEQRLPWPPMVYTAYRDLVIPSDIEAPGVIPEGSLAYRIVGDIVRGGVWLKYSMPDAAAMHEPSVRATARIRRFIADVAAIDGSTPAMVAVSWSPLAVARSTGLPVSIVSAGMSEVRAHAPADVGGISDAEIEDGRVEEALAELDDSTDNRPIPDGILSPTSNAKLAGEYAQIVPAFREALPAAVIRRLAQASLPEVRTALAKVAGPALSGMQLLIRSAATARLYELDGVPATLAAALQDHAASPVFGPIRDLVTRRLIVAQAQAAMRGQAVDLHRLTAMLDMPDDPNRPGTLAALRGVVLITGALVDAPGYDLDAALDRLGELATTLPPDNEYAHILAAFGEALLVTRGQHNRLHGPVLAEDDLPGPADLNGAQWLRRELMRLTSEAMAAAQRGDLITIMHIMPQLEDIVEQLPLDDPAAGQMRLLVSQVEGLMSGSAAKMSAAAKQPGLSRSERAARLFIVAAADCVQAAQAQDESRFAAAKEKVREVVELAAPDDPQLSSYLMLLGWAETTLYQMRGQRQELTAAIGHLEAAVRAAEHPGDPMWTMASMALAGAYRLDGRLAEGRRTGLHALRGSAWMVLLHDTPRQATDAARHAAEEAVEVARWCLADGDSASAARAVDAGRGLLLAATRVTATIAERLTRAGHGQLADRWRRQGDNVPTTASDLRHAVLTALAGPYPASTGERSVLDLPDLDEIRAALRFADADVLVYLLPGDANGPGTAILVPRDKAPYHLTLPQLTVSDGDAVHRHLAALGTRDLTAVSGPERTRSWRMALDDLCDWAWSAAIGPLLRDVGRWGLHRPPRLVLVPVGELATVPWHAARVRPGHFAVQDAVFSYAPSARILCDCMWRTPVDAHGSSLIVGDPTGDLPDAYNEATAIRDAYYPSALLLSAGEATPAAVLAALRRTTSMLHLACHGGLGPDGAYLLLADRAPLNASQLVEARDHKTIGLVVLTACTTGVPSGRYDEAFSIATAFLASGAVSVFGSLWPVPNDATSLLMFMAHHYLSVQGLRPVDALRRAQLWMLDSGRSAPAEMPAALTRLVVTIDRDDVAAWAGYIHLGRA